MSKPLLWMAGGDDPYFRTVYSKACKMGLKIDLLVLEKPGKLEGDLSSVSKVNASLLYLAQDVPRAFPGLAVDGLSLVEFSEWYRCERDFYACTDRLTAVPQPHLSRKNLFRELVLHWHALLKQRRPSHLFFSRAPHFGWDVVLFYVARALGVQTLYIQRTDIDDSFIFRSDWSRLHSDQLKSVGRSKDSTGISLDTLPTQSNWIQYSQAVLKGSTKGGRLRQWLKRVLRWPILALKTWRNRSPRLLDSALFQMPEISRWQLWKLYKTRSRANSFLKAAYDGLARPLPTGTKYIYFALHFQPERSTQPEGGLFEDQLLAARILATSLPEDCVLAIKEHPRQFDNWPPDLRKMHARDINDYERMAELPHTYLVPVDENSDQLIANATLTATITGTTGWQGLKLGIPALVFGEPWYGLCSAVGRVKSVADAKREIKKLKAMSSDHVIKGVNKFLKLLQPHLVRSSLGGSFAVKDTRADLMAEELAVGIVDRVNGNKAVL